MSRFADILDLLRLLSVAILVLIGLVAWKYRTLDLLELEANNANTTNGKGGQLDDIRNQIQDSADTTKTYTATNKPNYNVTFPAATAKVVGHLPTRQHGSIATVFTSSMDDTLASDDGDDDTKSFFDVVNLNYMQRTLTNETVVDPDHYGDVFIDVDWKEGQPKVSQTYTRDSNFLMPRFKNNVKIAESEIVDSEKRDTIIGTKLKSFIRGKTVKQYEESRKLKKEKKKEQKLAKKRRKPSDKLELLLIFTPQELTRLSVESSKKIWNVLYGGSS